jgi:hypothetical protein
MSIPNSRNDCSFSPVTHKSPAGGLVAVICVKESDDEGAWAILSVRDESVGVPGTDVVRIFERFHRQATPGISGTGIALATIREVVEHHGRTITVDSSEGRGSTCTIRLPLVAMRRSDRTRNSYADTYSLLSTWSNADLRSPNTLVTSRITSIMPITAQAPCSAVSHQKRNIV